MLDNLSWLKINFLLLGYYRKLSTVVLKAQQYVCNIKWLEFKVTLPAGSLGGELLRELLTLMECSCSLLSSCAILKNCIHKNLKLLIMNFMSQRIIAMPVNSRLIYWFFWTHHYSTPPHNSLTCNSTSDDTGFVGCSLPRKPGEDLEDCCEFVCPCSGSCKPVNKSIPLH